MIKNRAQGAVQTERRSEDLTELFYEFQQQYRNVFMDKIGDYVFIYRSLRRREYNEIISEEISELGKEELVCQICTLWPEEIDFEEFDEAGVVSELTKNILENSFLDSLRSQENVLFCYRQDMEHVYNQIGCIINEAFPNLSIEEIDGWDIEQTMFYLSKAEWKLSQLRNVPMDPRGPFYLSEETEQQNPVLEDTEKPAEAKQEEKKTTIRGGKKEEKLTLEKLEELQRKYPEIDFDAVSTTIIPDHYDTTPPALRTDL